jgi:hypothetical protein
MEDGFYGGRRGWLRRWRAMDGGRRHRQRTGCRRGVWGIGREAGGVFAPFSSLFFGRDFAGSS